MGHNIFQFLCGFILKLGLSVMIVYGEWILVYNLKLKYLQFEIVLGSDCEM